MRRPKRTAAQKKYDREQRAILQLRRASVAYREAMDAEDSDPDRQVMAGASLESAALNYSGMLTPRERRRLFK